jgi:hypothetical protein
MQALRFSGLDKQHLGELVRVVAQIQTSGLKPVKVLTKGIPPVVDGLIVQTLLQPNDLAPLTKILTDVPRIGGITIFPKGIPRPDLFLAEIAVE